MSQVAFLMDGTSRSRASNRRVAPRYDGNVNAYCDVLDDDGDVGWSSAIIDVSETGIGLLVDHKFAEGKLITLEFRNELHGFSRRIPVRVIHCPIQYPNDAWLHGCVFLTPLPERDLAALRKA